jgi:alkylresorcinol/alkylpyrone synthase
MYITEILLQSPQFKYDSSEIIRILEQNYKSPQAKDFILNRIANSGIQSRHFVRPLEEIVQLNGLQQRAEFFADALPNLFQELISKSKVKLNPQALITTSCTVPALPALDISLLNCLTLSSTPIRIPMYQHGCLGGVWSLALANKLEAEQTLICSYELCSLLFQAKVETLTQMMAAVLFADGIGAAVISKEAQEPLLKIIASAEYLIPDSSKILGYDILDNATHLILSPQIPALLGTHFPEFIEKFLSSHNLDKSQIKQFLAHPGGRKILDNIKDNLSLGEEFFTSSYAILENFGNMSSASIFFVIDHFLKQGSYISSDYVLILGIGPGINLELVLCQIP